MKNKEHGTQNISDVRCNMWHIEHVPCNMGHREIDIEQSPKETKWFSAAGEEVVPTHNATNNKRVSRKCTKGALGLIGQKRHDFNFPREMEVANFCFYVVLKEKCVQRNARNSQCLCFFFTASEAFRDNTTGLYKHMLEHPPNLRGPENLRC